MLKNLVLGVLGMALPLLLAGQPYGNEWVNVNKTYFKIMVNAQGIYRVTYQQLQQAGFPVATIDPRRLELWARGQQVAIWVEGEADGRFNEGDYIEFYGEENRASTDVELYDDPAHISNPYYNAYSGQRAYFLTYSLDGSFGKRMPYLYQSNTSLPSVQYHEELVVLRGNSLFPAGQLAPTYLQYGQKGTYTSPLGAGKGFTTPDIGTASNRLTFTHEFNIADYVPNTPFAPSLYCRVVGRTTGPHKVEVRTGTNAASLALKQTLEFKDVEVSNADFQLSDGEFPAPDGKFYAGIQVLDASPFINPEVVSVGFMELRYPQAIDVNGATTKVFYLPAQPQSNSRLSAGNPVQGMRIFDITDPTALRWIGADYIDGKLNAVVPNTNKPTSLYVTSEVKAVNGIEAVSFSTIPTNIDYIIISHRDLMQPFGAYENPVKAYADYRASAQGGSYKPYIADIDHLYNQFTYGEYTPAAIRRYFRYQIAKGGRPKSVFLLGKALELTFFYYYNLPASNAWPIKNLVPCMGYPGSDMLFATNLDGTDINTQAFPIGRVTATTPQHVANYLEKVKLHEQATYDNLKRKDFLILTGGVTDVEREVFRSIGNEFGRIIRNEKIGGDYQIFSKSSTDAVEIIDIDDKMNEGIQALIMFGHTSPNVADIEIGYPGRSGFSYLNKGKYPFMFINGCNSGDVYQRFFSLGEPWILAKDNGAIVYGAHSDWGYPSKLRYYSLQLLRKLYNDSTLINRPYGEAVIAAQQEFIRVWREDPVALATLHQIVFQGDPAIRLFPPTKPDYHAKSEELFLKSTVSGQTVTADADEFLIGIPVANYGITKNTPLNIAVKRTFNGAQGGEKWYETQPFSNVFYKDTLYYRLKVTEEDKLKAVGLNTFEVHLDYGNAYPELNEQNNVSSFTYVFPRSALRVIAPIEYSIVSSQPVTLTMQNLDLAETERNYIFQLDTTASFNSPVFREEIVAASYLPSWTVNGLISDNATDSTVYYWRVKFADVGNLDDPSWANSSFVYIKGSPEGWSQSHFSQFDKAELVGMAGDPASYVWQFKADTVVMEAKTVGAAGSSTSTWADYYARYEDATAISNGECEADYFLMIAVSHRTGQIYNRTPWPLICGFNGNTLTTTSRLQSVNHIRNSAGILSVMNTYIDSGDYVLMMGTRNILYSQMHAGNKDAMRRMGVDPEIFGTSVKSGDPFIALGRKDVPGYIAPVFVPNPNDTTPTNRQELFAQLKLPIQRSRGEIISTLIGPSMEWTSVEHAFLPKTDPADSLRLDLLGIDNFGNQVVLEQNLHTKPMPYNISDVRATDYPYLRLKASFIDYGRVSQQAPQLKQWLVVYKDVPEGILFSENNKNAFGEGENATFTYKFQNVGQTDFTQPIIFQYTFKKADGSVSMAFDTLQALPKGQSVAFTVSLPTLGLAGQNQLTVFANPFDQREQHYDNNVLQHFFDVRPDRVNPTMDVVFDGVHIMDGDIVSPTPVIGIRLKDENPYYTLSDTASLQLWLKHPGKQDFEEIQTQGNSAIRWVNQGANDLRIEFSPDRLPDGIYTLKAQAKDASGNASGLQPYQVNFEVVNASQITHFYPYPNPFSTNVRFVFTLTGDKLPDELKIQVMTVSGKVVREIAQEEIGPIRIGNNMTEYAWDGKDEFGGQLANGVYLYRVVANFEGQPFEQRQTARDHLFKNGIGKMYLLR